MPAYGSYLLYALALTVAFPNLAAAGLRHVAPRQDSDDVAPSTIPAEPTTTPDPTATDVPQGDVESATDASAPPDATTESSPPPEETEVASETEAPTESSTTPSVTETPSDAASATPTATSGTYTHLANVDVGDTDIAKHPKKSTLCLSNRSLLPPLA